MSMLLNDEVAFCSCISGASEGVPLDEPFPLPWSKPDDMSDAEWDKMIYDWYCPLSEPLAQLPPEWRHCPKTNPRPPLLHFGLVISEACFDEYIERTFSKNGSNASMCLMQDELAASAQCKHIFITDPISYSPLRRVVVSLYSNYNYRKYRLYPEDEEDVINDLREALNLGKEVKAMWYLNALEVLNPQVMQRRNS
ncbi:hypothetical protein BXZ70DRAFT_541427 [Cristinia sonorae]|uniref:Uncharacterized protein n=1 Tax=Cristinia sonorae TaxID=1940300 RepID=A0A8K0UFW5_9AGAR|nr:hypothetical protein BXZ70DRAFT_541427 [Cristinia sonorae]